MLPGRDPLEAARGYVGMVGLLRDRLLACRTEDDVRGVSQGVQAAIGWSRGAEPSVRAKLLSVYKGRTCPFVVDTEDAVKARTMAQAGFGTEVPAWRRGVRAVTWGSQVMLLRGTKRVGDLFSGEEAAWDWLRGDWEARRAAGTEKPDGPLEPERPHLDRLERTGPDVRGGRDVSPQEFLEEFSFRGVEFGNWLPDGERREVLNRAFEALHDLARAMDLPPRAMSLDGFLAAGFGSRGTGRALAHYEPGRRVFNLTRLRGAGSLAHEWAHALDHWLGTLGHPDGIENGAVRAATGWHAHTRTRADALPLLDPVLAGRIEGLMDAFRRSPKRLGEAIEDTERERAERAERLERIRANRARHLADVAAGARPDRKWLQETEAFMGASERRLPALDERLARLRAGEDPGDLGTGPSAYLRQAQALSGKGDYWTRPTELWARAFECAVHDLLEERGQRNDYLVHGVAEGTYAQPLYKGDPYPAGEERRRYREMFEAVFGDLRHILAPGHGPEPEVEEEASPRPR